MRNTQDEQRRAWAGYIQALRAATGMSRAEMGRRLGVDPTTVWRWETGKQKPESPAVVEALASLFKLDLDEVLVAAGLKPADEIPVEPTRDPDPELEAILLSGLPTKIQEELIDSIMQQRELDQERRLDNLRRTIRLAKGQTA